MFAALYVLLWFFPLAPSVCIQALSISALFIFSLLLLDLLPIPEYGRRLTRLSFGWARERAVGYLPTLPPPPMDEATLRFTRSLTG